MLASLTFFSTDNADQIVSSITDAGSRNVNIDSTTEGFEGEIAYLVTDTLRLDFNFLSLDSEVASGTLLVDPLNIIGATQRIPSPITGNMADVVPGTNGLMQVGFTDAGPLYKFAGYSCTTPFFNPLGGVFCPASAITPTDVSGNMMPGAMDLSYNIGLSKDFNTSGGMYTLRYQYAWMDERYSDIFNNEALKVDETEFTDLSLTFTPNDESYYIGFWVKNLDDDRSIQSIFKASNLQGGAKFANHFDPRTMGISFGINF